MSLRRTLGVGMLVASSAFTAGARAESVLLLSPQGDPSLHADQAKAQRVLLQTLEAQAVRVLAPEASMNDDLRLSAVAPTACDAVDCAAERLQTIGADAAAVLSVWADPGSPRRPGRVFVTLIDRDDARYPGRAKVAVRGADALARAVKDALLEARALQLLGRGPWLRVAGKPEGAQVFVDGQLAGTVPYRAAIDPGRHTVEVRGSGHRALVQTVDVPPNAARQVEVAVALTPRGEADGRGPGDAAVVGDAESSAEPPDESRDGSRPWVGPLLLGGAGVALVGADLVLVLSSGCQRRNTSGHCEKGYEVDDALAITWAAVGASAIVSAVLWHMLGGDEPPPADVAVLPHSHGAGVWAAARF